MARHRPSTDPYEKKKKKHAVPKISGKSDAAGLDLAD